MLEHLPADRDGSALSSVKPEMPCPPWTDAAAGSSPPGPASLGPSTVPNFQVPAIDALCHLGGLGLNGLLLDGERDQNRLF